MINSVKDILDKTTYADDVIIFGAGYVGKGLSAFFHREKRCIKCFFDNDVQKQGTQVSGIPIKKPYRADNNSTLYIVALEDKPLREKLRKQLISIGVSDKRILEYYHYRTYEYMCSLPEEMYQKEISDMYFECFGEEMNWDNPQTYNEIINWEKINIKDSRRTRLADKVLVRDWVREQIGDKYLTKHYGYWDDPSEIDFDVLPDSFVLKLNNGSGRNIVVKDKSAIDKNAICKQLNEWKDNNFAYASLEMQYKEIQPKVICEEYLSGLAESEYDYNIYCFHGKPVYIHCIKGSHRAEARAAFYDTDWNKLSFSYGPPLDEEAVPRPQELDKMLEFSEILCKNFEHVRVDWYDLSDGRLLFSEMTFSPWAGLHKWNPEEYNTFFGDLIRQPH